MNNRIYGGLIMVCVACILSVECLDFIYVCFIMHLILANLELVLWNATKILNWHYSLTIYPTMDINYCDFLYIR